MLKRRKYLLLFIITIGFLTTNYIYDEQSHLDKTFKRNNHYPGKSWNIIGDIESAGWSTSKLNIAREKYLEIGATALMIIDDGIVVAEWGDTKGRSNCYSVRKSFLSALFGIFVGNNTINPQNTLADLGIDDRISLSHEERQAKIVDLLRACSGVYHPAAYETNQMKEKRPKRGSHMPGTYWYYNNWDFNASGSIFEQETSIGIFEAFNKYIATPIGMEDFRVSDGTYIKEYASKHKAYPFMMSARDRARFGLLFLRKGLWKNKQIIPEYWVEESTAPYLAVEPGLGYGYMWWVASDKWRLGKEYYFAAGSLGQYIVIIPEINIVVVQVSNQYIGGKEASGKKFSDLLSLIVAAKKS